MQLNVIKLKLKGLVLFLEHKPISHPSADCQSLVVLDVKAKTNLSQNTGAHQFLLTHPQLLSDMLTSVRWTPPPHTEITGDIHQNLLALREEAFGEQTFVEYV
jgi:hypothetical protein